jgi:tRNA modification GTPase
MTRSRRRASAGRARAAEADLVLHIMTDAPPAAPASGQLIINMIDLGGAVPEFALGVSATRGDGIPELRAWLTAWAATALRPGEPPLLSHVRHAAAFTDAASALTDAAETEDAVLRAEGLRLAARAFGRIAGRVDVDDVLDRIFSRFCIGK